MALYENDVKYKLDPVVDWLAGYLKGCLYFLGLSLLKIDIQNCEKYKIENWKQKVTHL